MSLKGQSSTSHHSALDLDHPRKHLAPHELVADALPFCELREHKEYSPNPSMPGCAPSQRARWPSSKILPQTSAHFLKLYIDHEWLSRFLKLALPGHAEVLGRGLSRDNAQHSVCRCWWAWAAEVIALVKTPLGASKITARRRHDPSSAPNQGRNRSPLPEDALLLFGLHLEQMGNRTWFCKFKPGIRRSRTAAMGAFRLKGTWHESDRDYCSPSVHWRPARTKSAGCPREQV